jgi:hypothetical protein
MVSLEQKDTLIVTQRTDTLIPIIFICTDFNYIKSIRLAEAPCLTYAQNVFIYSS